jgi:hypothetical protein
MRWRSASEREGLSGCRAAQASISATFSSDNRNVLMGSRPVAGRPIFFFGITFCVDMRTNGVTKSLAIGIRFRPRPFALSYHPINEPTTCANMVLGIVVCTAAS